MHGFDPNLIDGIYTRETAFHELQRVHDSVIEAVVVQVDPKYVHLYQVEAVFNRGSQASVPS